MILDIQDLGFVISVMEETMTIHYRHDGSSRAPTRIRPPWLTEKAGIVDCRNCERTHAYQGHGEPAAGQPAARADADQGRTLPTCRC